LAIKLYRLAKDVEILEAEILEYAQQAGLKIKSHLETVCGEDELELRRVLGENGCDVPPPVSYAEDTPQAVRDTIAELTAPVVSRKEPEPVEEEPEPEAAAEVVDEAPETEEPVADTESESKSEAAEQQAEPEPVAEVAEVDEVAEDKPADTETESEAPTEPEKPQGVRVFDENPAAALIAAGGATHGRSKTKRSEKEQQILTKKLEELRHRDRGVAKVTRPTRHPKKARPQQTRGIPNKKDRKREKQELQAKLREKRENTIARRSAIQISLPITINQLSQELGIKAGMIIQYLMKEHGQMATINQHVDAETVELIALEFEKDVEVKRTKAAEEHISELEEGKEEIRKEDLRPRPPVVAILGHVDHGKTSILDKIRQSNVQAGEAGGITQNISAWQVKYKEHELTFIDTPGHEAFTEMRARGAHATDIVVLVVAADDGVMPQTIEAMNHAKAAEVPIIVALNKIDKENANPEKALQQLAGHGLQSESWGGDTPVVPCSAITGEGIDDLLEMIELVAEVQELQANPNMRADGLVLEGRKDEGVGNLATLLVQEGTLRKGDAILAGLAVGRVRSMERGLGMKRQIISEAGPAMPVEVTGLSEVPDAGTRFYVLESIAKAKEIVEDRVRRAREASRADRQVISLDNIFAIQAQAKIETIPLIIKADVKGSIEVLVSSLEKLSTKEVQLKILHTGVGGVNESDVLLADASSAIVLAFNVAPDDRARSVSDAKRVEIRMYSVIYELLDEIKLAMEGRLAPDLVEEVIGRCEIRKVFKASRVGNIAGCYVTQGRLLRSAKFRLIRDGIVVQQALSLDSLKHFKDDVREVKEKFECGLKLRGYEDIKEGDVLEGFIINEVKRKLE